MSKKKRLDEVLKMSFKEKVDYLWDVQTVDFLSEYVLSKQPNRDEHPYMTPEILSSFTTETIDYFTRRSNSNNKFTVTYPKGVNKTNIITNANQVRVTITGTFSIIELLNYFEMLNNSTTTYEDVIYFREFMNRRSGINNQTYRVTLDTKNKYLEYRLINSGYSITHTYKLFSLARQETFRIYYY